MAFDALVRGQSNSQIALPDELGSALQQLESEFLVDTPKLKQIVARFEEELREGRFTEVGFLGLESC